MEYLSCIIIDDNPQAIAVLRDLLESYFPEVKIKAEGHSVAEGVKLIKDINPDILFLDVEMPTENGTAIFDYVSVPEFETIFTTAYRDYAAQAFRLGTIDYLVKPIKPSELKEAIEKVKAKRLEPKETASSISPDFNQKDRITFSHAHAIEVYNIEDILYCQAESNYTLVQGLGKKIMVSKTLGYYEELLKPYGFFRINRSQVVNLKHVTRYEKSDSEIILSNDTKLLLSGRRKKEFLDSITGV